MLAWILAKTTQRPRLIIIIAALLSAFFAWQVKDVEYSSTVGHFFISGDPDKDFFEKCKKTFGHDGVTVVAMVAPQGQDIYTPERLEKIRRVSDRIERIEGVRKVVSLTHVQKIRGSGMSIYVEPLVDAIPRTTEEWESLKASIAENPMYHKNLVSKGGRAAAINVFTEDFDNEDWRYHQIMDQITETFSLETGPEKFYVAGIAATSAETNKTLARDLKLFMPLTFAFIIVVLALNFRSVRGVLLPLAAVAMSAVWTVGLMGVAGIPMSMVTVVLPPLIVAIGSAYSIHVISEYMDEAGEDSEAEEAVAAALNKLGVPMLICGLTTMIGFSTLALNRIPSIRDLGLSAAAGVFFTMVISLLVVPAALALMPAPGQKRGASARDEEGNKEGLLDELLGSVAEFDIRRRAWVLALSVGLSLAGAAGALRMEVNTDFLSFFDRDDPISVANRVQQKFLAGAAPMFVVLESDEEGAFKEPAMLRRMESFQRWLEFEQEKIDLTMSITDYIKLLNKVFHDNADEYYRVPDSRAEVAQLFLFYSFSGDPEDFSPYVNGDFSSANIMVRSTVVGSAETGQVIREIESYGKKLFRDKARIKVTGTIPMVNKSANEVAMGQMKGIGACLLVIFIIMSLIFVSPRVGFLAMIPNVLPILFLFGFMGYSGMPLNFSTSLIACIAVGLGVDDTIHLVSRYNTELKEAIDTEESIRRAVRGVGKPVIYSSTTLFFGFIIIAGSDFMPIRQFGILTSMVILVCLAADLVMLPALLSSIRVTTLWDYVDLRIGRQSAKARLFKGLNPHQAKTAALMGVFGFYGPGEIVIEAGEQCSDLYLVMEGSVAALSNGPGSPAVARATEGMEFGRLPGDEASPARFTWQAQEHTKLLVMKPMAMERLKKAHPAIAEKISRNMEEIRGRSTGPRQSGL